MEHGWMSMHHDAYDQRYYRTWMHELPPMRHVQRRSVLDVHHNILPETARLSPNATKLLETIRPLPQSSLYVLSPVDMVLHSATHLFFDGELEHGLRDLLDLDALLRHFGHRQDFWFALTERANDLGLVRPLYYALRYTQRFLETPVPDVVTRRVRKGGPKGAVRLIMDSLFGHGLSPHHSSCNTRLSGTARWMLYVRSHYLRMPLRLLIPHLVRKAVKAKR
jgi:hypothetical protein